MEYYPLVSGAGLVRRKIGQAVTHYLTRTLVVFQMAILAKLHPHIEVVSLGI